MPSMSLPSAIPVSPTPARSLGGRGAEDPFLDLEAVVVENPGELPRNLDLLEAEFPDVEDRLDDHLCQLGALGGALVSDGAEGFEILSGCRDREETEQEGRGSDRPRGRAPGNLPSAAWYAPRAILRGGLLRSCGSTWFAPGLAGAGSRKNGSAHRTPQEADDARARPTTKGARVSASLQPLAVSPCTFRSRLVDLRARKVPLHLH